MKRQNPWEQPEEVDRESAELRRRAVQTVAVVTSGLDPYMAGDAARVVEHADPLARDLG